MQSDTYLNLLSSYLLYNRVVAKSEFEFKSQKEYDEYLKLNPPTTVNNETVKSYGEMDIANFLMQNGIRYIYEHPYEIDTRTSEYGQYHPDFYPPDYKIYIEYFGINRNGEVPSYFKATNGMSATEVYRASMEWKRTTHREHQTTMIECYAYEKLEGNLLDSLKEKLEAASVSLAPKSSKELWTQVAAEGDSLLDGIIELFETLVNLIKSNGYDIATVRKLNHAGSNTQTNNILLSLLEPIFNAYCKYLADHQEIDFNDMINLASEYVRQGKYINPYKYVIVDEYQDISKARFTLLDCLRKSRDYELFCVGDDWQSIYRFAGSDIGFILNFSKYWGATEVSKIETTYRFSQKLIEISGGFIMQNPVQIKKSIRGNSEDFGFPLGEISGYTDKFAIEFMSKKLNDIPKGSSVFFIGRYSFDAKLLNDSGLFSCQYNNTSGFVDVKAKSRPDLNMVFLTAHKSKGLQADYVFIINNKKSRMGFPSKIQDAPILDLLLDNCDQYIGCTVNFKTYTNSIWDKKQRDNPMENRKIFYNTHPAIISLEVFDKVQEIRQQRHRRTATGKSNMFSGLVFCDDCKQKLYYSTTNYFEKRQDFFICSTHRTNKDKCSGHYIRAVVLEQEVWKHIQEVISVVTRYEAYFRSEMEEKLRVQSEETLRIHKKRLAQAEKRIGELDRLSIRSYEDNVSGKIDDERFAMMNKSYTQEQKDLKAEVISLQQVIEEQERQAENLEQFIQRVKRNSELTELTPYALRELVKAVYVEAPYKSSGKRKQKIHISYDLIGFIPVDVLTKAEQA